MTGLARASGWSHPASRSIGVNVELMNVSGTIGRNRARPAVSGSWIRSASHDIVMPSATPKVTAITTMPAIPGRPVATRNPRSDATPSTRSAWTAKIRLSASIRPSSTALRAIGSDRNRSVIPLAASSTMPSPTVGAVSATFCTMMPGTRYCR